MHILKVVCILPITVLFSSSLLWGCGSDAPGESTSDAAQNPQDLCTSRCAFLDRCQKENRADCNSICTDFINQSSLRESYVSGVSACFQTLSCESLEEDCIEDFRLADIAYPNVYEVTLCLTERDACGSPDGPAFADDLCRSIVTLDSESRSNAAACLSQDCAEIEDCLRAVGSFTY